MPTVAVVEFDVPPGVSLKIDGGGEVVTPAKPVELSAGRHRVELSNGCQGHVAKLELAGGERKTLSLAAAPSLEYGSVALDVRSLAGEAVATKVWLGKRLVAEGVKTAVVAVPTCALRMKLESEVAGLGGYIEDVKLQKGQHLVRKIVLAPGPDMVRIHGGDFVMGPPPSMSDEDMNYIQMARYPVKVEDFDLDRTEVTAAQFMECVKAGPCSVDALKMDVADLERMAHTRGVTPEYNRYCTVVETRSGKHASLHIVPGRENHPVNCIAHWQAAEYCEWAGRRLPNDVEWEYAARSGKEEYDCPFGVEGLFGRDCTKELPRKPDEDSTMPVCTWPETNSEQGICDLGTNIGEWVTEATVAGRSSSVPGGPNCSLAANLVSYQSFMCTPKAVQSVAYGVRCARSMAKE